MLLNNPLTVIGGEITQADLTVELQSVIKSAVAGRTCSKFLWERESTLRQALIDCTNTECKGLSWMGNASLTAEDISMSRAYFDTIEGSTREKSRYMGNTNSLGFSKQTPTVGKMMLFRACSAAADVDDSERAFVAKPPTTQLIGEKQATSSLVFSFQPKGLTVKLGAGEMADTGDVYGPRNGQQYGWNCEMPSNISSNTNTPP
jgi:hypothetical protein